MKSIWTIIALAGFISVSVFGLVLMPYDGSHHDVSCLASIINQSVSPCPEQDPIGFANFHNGAVQKVLSIIPVDAVSIAYLALMAVLIFGLFYLRPFRNLLSLSLVSISDSIVINHPPQIHQRNWFSLHEHSPSFL